jgi:hypothetical protein
MADIPSTSITSFNQTNAPTGWTKITTYNDYALRITTGTTGVGGSTAFSSIFSARIPTGTLSGSASTGSTTLDSTMIPSHYHTATRNSSTLTNAGYTKVGGGYADLVGGPVINSTTPYTSTPTGGGGSHSHAMPLTYSSPGFTGSLNVAVKYVDLILAQRN